MPHFYVKPENIRNGRFCIQGDESHHLLHVLRKKVGDCIKIFDGEHNAYRARIEHIQDKEITGSIESCEDSSKSPSVQTHLFQVLPKGSKFEFIIEKCTELGVSSITPIISSRCAKHIPPDRRDHNYARWKKIVESACKQCGRMDIPVIHEIQKISNVFCELDKNALHIMPWEGEAHKTLKNIFADYKQTPNTIPSAVHFWIGPEGGFTLGEVKVAEECGIQTVSLGERILRTETAGLVTLSLIQYELDNMQPA